MNMSDAEMITDSNAVGCIVFKVCCGKNSSFCRALCSEIVNVKDINCYSDVLYLTSENINNIGP